MTSVLTNNSTSAPLQGSATYFGAWVATTSFQAIKVSVLADEIGTLVIQHATTASPSNIVFEDTKAVNADTETFMEVIVKSAFFRVKYENGTNTQSSFKLQTTSGLQYGGDAPEVQVVIDAETSSIAVWGQKPNLSLSPIQLDASGNLKTTATLSVEGTLNVSDADTHDLLTDLSGAVWENTDRMLYDLDIIANHGTDASANALAILSAIETQTTDLSNALTSVVNGLKDISGSVSIRNFPATQDISGSVSVSNQISGFATESTLDAVATTAEDISLQLLVPQRSWVEVDFDTQSSQIVQGSGTWRVPLTGEQGWEYLNSTIGGATAYFYSNTALVANGQESDITLGSLTTMWFVGNYRLATAVNPNRRFYLSVYTKPQGAGDFQPWYRSSKTYQLPNSAIVSKGADVFYYAGLDISTIYKEYDHTAYELAVSRGPCASDEVIQFLALQVDSATPANEFDGIVKHAGFSTAGGTNRVVSFTRASREKIAEDNLKALTVQSGELQVKDASAVALLAEIANGITVQVGQVEISGVVITEISGVPVVEISGSVVADVSFPAVQMVEVSGVPVVEISGSVVADVSFPAVQVVEVSGVPVVEISGSVVADVSFPAVQMVEVSGVPVVEISGSVVADVSFPTIQVVEVSGAVIADMSGATFTDSKLNVLDASAVSHLSVIEEILETGFVNVYDASSDVLLTGIKTQTDKLSFQNEGTYETLRVRVENPSSGGGVVEISGVSLVDGKLPVYDASANEPLSKLSFYADGYGAYDLRTQITNSVGVSVNNQPTVSLAPFTEVGLVSGTQVALASGSEVSLAFGSQVALASGSQVQLTNSEVGLINGSQIYANLRDNNGNAIGSQVSGEIGERAINTTIFAWDNANDTIERVRLGEEGGLQIQNANGTTLQVEVVNTPTVEISGNIAVADLSVNILNSSLDTHIYGSHDGTTFHHILTTPQGKLVVNSSTQDGNGNNITSTSVSGGVQALDVSVKGTASVSNSDASALITTTRDASFVQIANNLPTQSAGTFGSSQDTQGYTWIGALMRFTSVSTGGSIYMEFSADNTNWGRAFDSVFVNSGANVSALIRLTTPCAFRYVRLVADSPFSSTGASAWISMK